MLSLVVMWMGMMSTLMFVMLMPLVHFRPRQLANGFWMTELMTTFSL